MSDEEPPKKPSGAPSLAPQVVRSFPPVPRPAVEVREAEPSSSDEQAEAAQGDEEPPSLEALVAPRATQVSEPLALEALGRAARLVVNPISTAPAPSVSVEYDSAPSQARAASEVQPVASPGAFTPPEAVTLPDAVVLSEPSAVSDATTDPGARTTPTPGLPAVDPPVSEVRAPIPRVPDAAPPDEAAADAEAPVELDDAPPVTTPSIPSPESTAVTTAPSVAAGPADRHAPDSAAFVTRLVASLMITTSLVMVIWHMQLTSRENANTGSRYATIESLVDYGTYNIDASRYLFTPDKVKARDHFVSSKPPLLPTYGAGVYWLLKRITGWNILDNESIVVWTVGVFTGWLSHLVFLLYFYKLCKLLLVRQLAILVTLGAACFAYLGVAYATAINNHSVGAAFAVAGFYHAFKAKHGLGGKLEWVFAGLALGILPAIDLSSLALTGLIGLYLGTKSWRYAFLLYLPAALPGLVTQPLLAHAATGTWIPAYADASLMTYKGSYFGGRRAGIDALFEPKSVYAFNVLVGHHGVFSMTPIFNFGLFEIVRRLWKREKFVPETIVFTICFTVVTAFYIIRTHNYGGWCVGMRWLVPVMPWLLVMFGLWLDRATINTFKWVLVVAAFAVSAFNVQDGLTSPFQFSVWHNFLEDAPNRNRIGTTWVLSKPGPNDKKKPRGRPRH